jgi:streptogramin lyase
MRSLAPKLLIAGLALSAALVWAPGAFGAPAVTGTFKVPGVSTNNKDVAGPEGDIWVTLEGSDNVARVTPTGDVKEFELGLEGTTGIAVGPEGKLWVTAKEAVAGFKPGDPEGSVEETTITTVKAEGSAIVAGPEHKMWVATEGEVLRFSPATPATHEEVLITGLAPHDIDSVGSVVAVADGGAPRIITFTTAFEPHEIKYGAMGGSQGLAIAPSGQIGFSDPGANPEQIGLVTPPNPAQLQEQLGDPFGVAYGEDGAFWFAQFNDGGVVRLTADGQKSFLAGLPKMSARQITTGPDHTLWVTLTKATEEGLARISGVEPPPAITEPAPAGPAPTPPAPIPNTRVTRGPKKVVTTKEAKAMVRFSFSATVAGSTFQCKLTKVPTGKKKKKAPKRPFSSCRSPRIMHLAPGKYRFAVRAVDSSGVDPSPVERAFKVVRAPRHR